MTMTPSPPWQASLASPQGWLKSLSTSNRPAQKRAESVADFFDALLLWNCQDSQGSTRFGQR